MSDIKYRVWDNGWENHKYLLCTDGSAAELNGFSCPFFSLIAPEFEFYTGIDDKNGVKIYKNDVVKTYAMIPGDEKYVDAVPTGVVKYYEGAYWIDNNNSALRLFQESIQIEVIGNIHENPELLGGNK